MTNETITSEQLTILLDLCRKAEKDTSEALDRVLAIAPLEARAGIIFHTAFSTVSIAGHALVAIRERHQGPAADPAAEHWQMIKRVLACFDLVPDMEAVDRAMGELFQELGARTASVRPRP